MDPLAITGSTLTIEDVEAVARWRRPVRLGGDAVSAIEQSESVVRRAVCEGRIAYGITTGFGSFADRVIPAADVLVLQRNLLRSHAVGVGQPLADEIVRAMLLLRANALACGASGVRLKTVQTLIDMLNRGVVPIVPEKGSVGASGDLAPLAHLTLVLVGEGTARLDGRTMSGADALAETGIAPLELGPKEGLALINGTQQMTATGALVLHDAKILLTTADIIGAMSLEAVRGTNRAFDARVHALRPHPGQIASAGNLRRVTAGSEIMTSHRDDNHKVQDPYSFRCMPQVHGASRDAVSYAAGVVTVELNSATDNPLIFADGGDIISCGNFHGQPVGLAMDTAGIAIAELANISERRIEAMLEPHFSELPPFLTRHAGLESGYMVSQYTAAALVSENKILAHPATVDSIPTSANQEDHVSMGSIAARKAAGILWNAQVVMAIELLCAAEGIDYRRPLHSGAGLEAVHRLVRDEVPHLDDDRPLHPDIDRVVDLIRTGAVVRAVESALGPMD